MEEVPAVKPKRTRGKNKRKDGQRTLTGCHPQKWKPVEDGCSPALYHARWASATMEVEGEEGLLADWHQYRREDTKGFLKELANMEKANDIRLGKVVVEKAQLSVVDVGSERAEKLVRGLIEEFLKEHGKQGEK